MKEKSKKTKILKRNKFKTIKIGENKTKKKEKSDRTKMIKRKKSKKIKTQENQKGRRNTMKQLARLVTTAVNMRGKVLQ